MVRVPAAARAARAPSQDKRGSGCGPTERRRLGPDKAAGASPRDLGSLRL